MIDGLLGILRIDHSPFVSQFSPYAATRAPTSAMSASEKGLHRFQMLPVSRPVIRCANVYGTPSLARFEAARCCRTWKTNPSRISQHEHAGYDWKLPPRTTRGHADPLIARPSLPHKASSCETDALRRGPIEVVHVYSRFACQRGLFSIGLQAYLAKLATPSSRAWRHNEDFAS